VQITALIGVQREQRLLLCNQPLESDKIISFLRNNSFILSFALNLAHHTMVYNKNTTNKIPMSTYNYILKKTSLIFKVSVYSNLNS